MNVEIIKNHTLDEEEILAQEAVKIATYKAKVCKKPIARYDKVNRKPYLEYPDGHKEY